MRLVVHQTKQRHFQKGIVLYAKLNIAKVKFAIQFRFILLKIAFIGLYNK